MAQDLSGLQAELQTIKGILGEMRGEMVTKRDLAELNETVAGIDKKVQYLSDALLGDTDHKILRVASSKR